MKREDKQTLIRALIFLALLIVVFVIGMTADASEVNHYEEYCEEIGEKYNICPEFIEAVIEAESTGNPNAENNGSVGLMQINVKYHQERMEKLGVVDLYDPYSNILVGTDYLAELFEKYKDPCLVLMCYNEGESSAVARFESGIISDYATKVTELAAELEREHGK